MTMWKKQILASAIRMQKENWGVTTRFSQIIELKFGKKLPYILCILTFFRIMVALLSLKHARLPTLFFLDSSISC